MNPRATALREWRVTDERGWLSQGVVWQVPISADYPDGVKYRLALIPAGRDAPVVLYDNHQGRGHHRHVRGQVIPYDFQGVGKLIADFEKDVEEAQKGEPQ